MKELHFFHGWIIFQCVHVCVCACEHLLMYLLNVISWGTHVSTFFYKYLLKSLFSIFVYIFECQSASSCGNFILYILRYHQTVFHSSYTTSHYHQQCTSVLISWLLCQYFFLFSIVLSYQYIFSIFLSYQYCRHPSRY